MMLWLSLSGFILLLLGGIHVYWAFGGKWGASAALPTKAGSQQTLFVPGAAGTMIVACLLFCAAMLLLMQGRLLPVFLGAAFIKWSCWACAAAFMLRTIGDFNYVGLFRKVRTTRFAKFDLYLFTPLCLLLSAAFFAAASLAP
ncbi:DUF3995 domain-containing protein [Paenibacillus sp. Leaf72]|uniref:DUF3995 domain-containing protein n=1 Tax=Paenibacillus sp. Leaf72 TaxID=1736234 RepID=UPI0007003284|nr:DUF3995 domain-containing protein [Paenibacillus sp. Leaf72]KQO00655.1 hypothetical protein ASF12_18035 [Paenibacillus sp. Leaf72]